jgi:hypothetical protein
MKKNLLIVVTLLIMQSSWSQEPPVNNYPANAIELIVGADATIGSNVGATASEGRANIQGPECGDYRGGDVWYKVAVPESGSLDVETDFSGAGIDTALGIYSYNVTYSYSVNESYRAIACNNDQDGSGYSRIKLYSQEGFLYVRVWSYGDVLRGTFKIAARDIDTTPPVARATDKEVTLDSSGNASITPEEVGNESTDNSGVEPTYTLSKTTFDCVDLSVGVSSNALDFDGSNDIVSIPGLNINPSAKPALTSEAWIKVKSLSGIQTIVGNDDGGYDRGMVIMSGTYHIFAGRDINTGIVPVLNTWHHVAVSWTASSVKLFVNGVNVYSTSGESISEGYNYSLIGGPHMLKGTIDEVRIWDVARTELEIRANMNSELSSQQGLVALYHFNEGLAYGNNGGLTAASDASGNLYNGRLINFALTSDTSNWVERAMSRVGVQEVILTATDGSGNSSSATAFITVVDITPPVIDLPKDIKVDSDIGKCGAVITYDNPTATDNCTVGTPIGVRSDALALDALYPLGTTTITWNVSDASSNAADEVTQKIVVSDNQVPVIVSSGDKSVTTDSNSCAATVVVSATATDNCTVGTPTGVRSDALALDALYPVGTTTITWTATDASSNDALAVTQKIVVIDNQVPVIVSSGDKKVDSDLGKCGAAITYDNPTATDNCSVSTPTGVRSDALALDALYPVGTTTITWNVSDASSNAALAVTQKIVVIDNQVPVIVSSGDKNVNTDLDSCGASIIPLATATDNCSVSTPTGVRSDALALDALYPVGTTTITWTATDASSNAADEVTQKIVVIDNQVPVIVSSGDKSVTTDLDSCGATVVASANATDNCSASTPTGVRSDALALDALYPVGTTTITWTATDASSNAADEVTQKIVVLDNQVPVIVSSGDKKVDSDPGKCGAAITYDNPTATDNCSVSTPTGVRSDALALDALYPVGTTTIIWTATDVNGNTSSATAVITVIDPNAANVTFTAPADLCIGAGEQRSLSGGLPSGGVYSGTGVTDDRNGSTYSYDPATAGDGTHSIRYTFTNASGCAASASDDVAVLEPAGPVVDVITVTVDGGCGSYAGFYNFTSMLNDKKSYSTTNAGNIISYNGSKWVLQQSGGSMRVLFENSSVAAGVTPPLTGWVATRYCRRSTMEVGLGVNFTGSARAEDLARVTTGTNLQFYDVATAGTPLRSVARLTKTVYYVSDTVTATGCESKRTSFNVNIEGGGGGRTRPRKFASSADKTALDKEALEDIVLFSMYPNPSAENVTVSSNMDGDFRIFNLVGQLVKTFRLKANLETVVYVGDLRAGTYVVKPTNSSSISSQKLIIRK